MKQSKTEADFFRYFDNVEIVPVPTQVWERYALTAKQMQDRYGKGDAE